MLNSFLNNFFFGYLTLKWKRLIRVLSVFFILFFPALLVFWLDETVGLASVEERGFRNIGYVSVPILIGLISWVAKPFIVKD